MPEALRVLGQSAPGANVDTNLYSVPAGTMTAVSTLTVTNRDSATTALFRVAVRPAAAAIANQHYLYYDAPIGPNSTLAITIGMTLATTDVITVRASTANVSWTAFGTEVTA